MPRSIAPLAIAAILAGTPAHAFGQPAPVTLKAADGVTLKATYYPAAKPGPGLVLLHQCNSERSSWAAFAQAAAARGIHVIAMDYRGFGESGGPRFDNFQAQQQTIAEQWPLDVDLAFNYLTSQPGVDKSRIGAAGASCGVNQAAQLARRHPEVKALVLLSGTVQPDARQHIRDAAHMPVMAAASLDDGNIVQTMRWIVGWSRNPASTYVEYKTAGHGTDMFAVEKDLQPKMLDWFDRNLRAEVTATRPAAASTPTPVEEFWSLLAQPGGIAKARALFEAAKQKGTAAALFPESELNQFGYDLLQQQRTRDAIVVFQMNVDAYPASANTYDSLSDAYLADGNTAEALRFAERALVVLASDKQAPEEFKAAIRQSAEGKIKQLKK